MIYLPIFNDGILISELWVFHVPQFVIHSNVPPELIDKIVGEKLRSFQVVDTTEKSPSNKEYDAITDSIRNSILAAQFSYPSILFSGSVMIQERKERYMSLLYCKSSIDFNLFTENVNPIEFHALRWHFMRKKLLAPVKFDEGVQSISREVFENKIADIDTANEYVRLYNDHNLFYSVVDTEANIYILSTGLEPELIFIVK